MGSALNARNVISHFDQRPSSSTGVRNLKTGRTGNNLKDFSSDSLAAFKRWIGPGLDQKITEMGFAE
jgi:hypothetical protein